MQPTQPPAGVDALIPDTTIQALTPESAAQIPGRVVYGGNERLQNPNLPPPSEQPARNWNYANITCPTGNTGS